jgi:GTP-binding protein
VSSVLALTHRANQSLNHSRYVFASTLDAPYSESLLPVPVVAIVGRPNVGKSSLFNCLAGRRIAIVDPTAGVTRDRVSTLVEAGDRYFELVDTGGMGIQDVDNLTAEIEQQITHAIEAAEIILFVVDARTGITPLDHAVAKRLRGVDKRVVCVANKCDTPELEPQAAEFHRLGGYPLICVSAEQKRGRDELLDFIARNLPKGGPAPKVAVVSMKLAIVGRRNTGKSTFINCLAQSERMIVSEVAGTTRDSVDVRFESDGKTFIAIDTAGVRRKGSVASNIEFYSLARAERSIRRADVVLLFLDARAKISKVDKQLAGYILEQNRPAIFVVNKWDLMRPMPTGQFGAYIRATFPSLDYVPLAFITAKDGRNVHVVLNLAQNLAKQARARVSTGELNRVLRKALEDQPPPLRFNRRPKITFATQVAAEPPTIVLFTNGPELFDLTYQRYLLKTFRDHLPFGEVAIKMYLRHKHRDEIAKRSDDKASYEKEAQPEPRVKRGQTPPPRRKKAAKSPTAKGKPAKRQTTAGDSGLWKDL